MAPGLETSRGGLGEPAGCKPGRLAGSAARPEAPTYALASTDQDDLSLAGYQKHLSSCAAPAPLTSAERELQQIRINEVGAPGRARARGHVRPRWPNLCSLGGLRCGGDR